MAPLPRKALIAITSATKPLHDDKPTGLFIGEALHPFLVLREAGFEVVLTSETGKYTPDSLSLTEAFLNGKDKEIYEDKDSEFRKLLDNMPKAKDVDESQVSPLHYRNAVPWSLTNE
jgi:D-lactate dehydratase